jgi:uncharacterized protein YceH (UPF0502 family)
VGIELDTLEQRVIGVLIEKELTTPDQYPLSLNALVAGCNQKNNRDPVLGVESYDVEGALRALMDRGWVVRREPAGSRVLRYAHEARSQLGVEDADLALLSELLCRGPQAPGALKTRCSRMVPFASADEVEERLAALSVRPVPYVVELERRPRERQARWQHMLGRQQASLGVAPALEPVVDPHPPAAPTAPAATRAPAAEPAPGAAEPADDATERLARLERRVEALERRLERLEGP